MRLAPTVQGIGEHGLVSTLISIARKSGIAAYPGDGLNRWGAVHLDDAARLHCLAVELGAVRPVYHAVAEEGIAMKDIMTAVSAQFDFPVGSSPDDHFGWIAMFARASIAGSGVATPRAGCRWRPSLLADLHNPTYYAAA